MPPLATHTEGGHSSAVPLLRSLADSAVVVLVGVLEMTVSVIDSNGQRPWCISQLSRWNAWSAWIQYGYPILENFKSPNPCTSYIDVRQKEKGKDAGVMQVLHAKYA